MNVLPFSVDAGQPDDGFSFIADAICSKGYAIIPAGLPASVASCLQMTLEGLERSAFRRARVGRGMSRAENRFVRRDLIRWIDSQDAALDAWHEWTEDLRLALNRRLYLGLFSFESHFAIYRPGAFYKRHTDAFRGQSGRTISLVTYLNEGWAPEQGGELVIYEVDGGDVRVTPEFGTVVVFLSEEFPHEILPAHRNRYSVAGWFSKNTQLPSV